MRSPRTYTLSINRNFTLLWLGQTISVLGDAAFDTTLALWISLHIARGQSWAPFAFSGVYLAGALPSLLFGSTAGVFVDRWDKRTMMLIMDVLRALLIFLLIVITGLLPLPSLPRPSLPIAAQLVTIYIMLALVSTCGQLFGPAATALFGDIVPELQRTQATGLSNTTIQIGWLIGPAIGSVLVVRYGIMWGVLLNALSFVVSWACVLFIRAPKAASSVAPGDSSHFLREFIEGLRFVRSNGTIATIILSGLLFMFGIGMLNTLYPFFLTKNLHADASLYGLFVAIPATGATLGAALMSKLAVRLGEGRTLYLSQLLCGGAMLLLVCQEHFWPAAFLLFLIGIANAGINTVTTPLLLHTTPRELIGRTMGLIGTCMNATFMLSTFLAGALSATALHQLHITLLDIPWNFVNTLYTCSGLLFCAAGLYTLRKLDNLRNTEEIAAASPDPKMPADTPI
jgi:MFS family permease